MLLYIDFLFDIQKNFDTPSVLLPTSDVTVIAISQFQDNLSNTFKFNISTAEIIEKITSKEGFYQLAQKYNLTVPKSFSVENNDALENIISLLEFPCAIKPFYSHAWRTRAFREKYGIIRGTKNLGNLPFFVRLR